MSKDENLLADLLFVPALDLTIPECIASEWMCIYTYYSLQLYNIKLI